MGTIHTGGHLGMAQTISIACTKDEWEDILSFLKRCHLYLVDEIKGSRERAKLEKDEAMRKSLEVYAERLDTKRENLHAYIEFIQGKVYPAGSVY